MKALSLIPNSFWESIQQKTIGGTPDVLGCINGFFIAIEFKSAKGTVSALQDYKLKRIAKAGGIAFVCWPDNFDDILLTLKHLARDK